MGLGFRVEGLGSGVRFRVQEGFLYTGEDRLTRFRVEGHIYEL